MKRNESGDFCVLYIESTDERANILNTIIGQRKPVVILLMEQARVFQRPDDFTALKHVKRQLDIAILFVIPTSEHQMQMASRNGFPVYLSMDDLSNAIATGQLTRQRTLSRTTSPLTSFPSQPGGSSGRSSAPLPERREWAQNAASSPKKTVQLAPVLEEEYPMQQKTTTPLSKTTGDVRPPSGSPSMPLAHEHTDSIQRVPTKPLQQPITPPPPVQPNRGPTEKRSPLGRLSVALIVLLLFALVAAGIGYYLSIRQGQTGAPTVASPTIVGHVYFLSSEQLSENSSQGINDEIQVDLTHLAAPAAQKSYYAWLLGDKSQGDARASALGVLQVKQGAAHLFYPGDTHHTNLLEIAGRFLVTEEDAAVPPIAPSPDYSTWRYYAEFSQVPLAPSTDTNVTIPGAATKSYSYLDHLRHLLAADPTLDELELPGGLNNWLYRNMGKVLEWTSSLRENWEENQDTGFMRRQLIRTLTYLDGMSYVQRDVPPSIPLNVNERLARVGLVEVAGPDQNPPSYLDHLIFHLNGLLSAVPHPTPAFRVEVSQLIDALSNVRNWLTKVRQEDLQLLQMSDMQVRQTAAFTMLNDLIDNANHAYVGQSDPATGGMHEGVIWIHDHMQALATLDVTAYQGQGAHP